MRNRRIRFSSLAILAAGCSGLAGRPLHLNETASRPVASVEKVPALPESPEPSPRSLPKADPAGEVLLSGDAGLVRWRARMALHADGTLRVGEVTTRVALDDHDVYFWKEQASLQTVLLDDTARHAAILLTTPTDDPEDPPNRYRLFLLRGGRLITAFDEIIGVYGVTPLVFPGDGTMRYLEDGWTACERAGHPMAPVPREEVVLELDGAGSSLVEVRRRPSLNVQSCDQLAACPFVYVVRHGSMTLTGEILRNLRGRDAYALQSLELPAAEDGRLRILLAEEKPEVTYLDAIYLEVDGQRVLPEGCRGEGMPAYCAADHIPHVMRRGDTLTLDFPAPSSGAELMLFARGYYTPSRR